MPRKNNNRSGNMSVREAGQRGGKRTSETHGRDFYENIGGMGGQKVKDLIEKGKRREGDD